MKDNLYDIFAQKWKNGNGTVWVYSDPHFGDLECYKLRYPTTFQKGTEYMHDSLVEKLDEEQVKKINSKVGKNDTIIFLGDIGNIDYIKKIRGYKVLIMGNHDKGASNYKRTYYNDHVDVKIIKNGIMLGPNIFEDNREYKLVVDSEDNHLFDEVYEGPLMINDRLILSHEPIEQLPKYMFNIHGHDHSNKFSSDHHMNVCAENINYIPVNLLSLLKTGLLSKVDNIHRCCIDKATKDKKKRKKKNV